MEKSFFTKTKQFWLGLTLILIACFILVSAIYLSKNYSLMNTFFESHFRLMMLFVVGMFILGLNRMYKFFFEDSHMPKLWAIISFSLCFILPIGLFGFFNSNTYRDLILEHDIENDSLSDLDAEKSIWDMVYNSSQDSLRVQKVLNI